MYKNKVGICGDKKEAIQGSLVIFIMFHLKVDLKQILHHGKVLQATWWVCRHLYACKISSCLNSGNL